MKKFIYVIMIVLNIIMVIALILVYLSCFIKPEKIWWLGFWGLVYSYIFIGNFFFVILWLFSAKKKFALISLVSILFTWTLTSRTFQFFGKRLLKNKNSIKIITYNVGLFNVKSNQTLNIFDYLKNEAADIICMQEFVSSKWRELYPDSIGKWLEKPYYHFERPGKWSQGIATYSAYPIIRNQLVYADSTLNACMYSDIVVDADTVRVFNLHLKTTGLRSIYDKYRKHKQGKQFLDFAKEEYTQTDIDTLTSNIALNIIQRSKQVEQIARYIDSSPYPVIICGDFNDPPVSYAYQKIRGNRKDAFIESGKGRGTSFNIRRILAQRVDFIIHSPIYQSYNCETPRVDYSDHFPVTCRLVKQK